MEGEKSKMDGIVAAMARRVVVGSLLAAALLSGSAAVADDQPCTEQLEQQTLQDLALFLKEPTDHHADVFLADLQCHQVSGSVVNPEHDGLIMPGYGRDYPRVLALANAGNIGAIKVLFEMTSIFDADPGETLAVDLGNVSDIKPYEFLVAYAATKEESRGLESTLGGLGPDYLDDFPAQIKKLKKRYAALKSAKGAPIQAKEECLSVIRQQIEELQEGLQRSKSQPQVETSGRQERI